MLELLDLILILLSPPSMQVIREVIRMLKRLKEQEEAKEQLDTDEDTDGDGSDQAVHDDLEQSTTLWRKSLTGVLPLPRQRGETTVR